MAVIYTKVRLVDVPLTLRGIRQVGFIIVVAVVGCEPPPCCRSWPRRRRWALVDLCVLHIPIELGFLRKSSSINQGVWRSHWSSSLRYVWRKCFIIVLDIEHPAKPKLLDIAKAGCLPRLLSCLCEDWEENGCENHDNGDNDEELDKRKGTFLDRLIPCRLIGLVAEKRPVECAVTTHPTGLLLSSQPLCTPLVQNEMVIERYLRRTFSVLLIWMTLPSWITIWTSPWRMDWTASMIC
jgi:hypothetical protein